MAVEAHQVPGEQVRLLDGTGQGLVEEFVGDGVESPFHQAEPSPQAHDGAGAVRAGEGSAQAGGVLEGGEHHLPAAAAEEGRLAGRQQLHGRGGGAIEVTVRSVEVRAPDIEALGERRHLGPVGVVAEGQRRLHQLPPEGGHALKRLGHRLQGILPHPRLGVDPGGVGPGGGPAGQTFHQVQGVLYVHPAAAIGVQGHGGGDLADEEAFEHHAHVLHGQLPVPVRVAVEGLARVVADKERKEAPGAAIPLAGGLEAPVRLQAEQAPGGTLGEPVPRPRLVAQSPKAVVHRPHGFPAVAQGQRFLHGLVLPYLDRVYVSIPQFAENVLVFPAGA